MEKSLLLKASSARNFFFDVIVGNVIFHLLGPAGTTAKGSLLRVLNAL